MIISNVWEDTSKRKRSSDWCVNVRQGAIIEIWRYATKEAAEAAKAEVEAAV